nr:immunoglobulin light chain junction region [Macaca mulatta]MOW27677.1 immunoglobulin light chain junction region [Macaca mulatta]
DYYCSVYMGSGIILF